MNQEDIRTRVNELMHQGFEIPADKLQPEATLFEELGLDSLDAVDMLVHLEENIGIKVEGEKLAKVRTLQDVYQLVADVVNSSKETQ